MRKGFLPYGYRMAKPMIPAPGNMSSTLVCQSYTLPAGGRRHGLPLRQHNSCAWEPSHGGTVGGKLRSPRKVRFSLVPTGGCDWLVWIILGTVRELNPIPQEEAGTLTCLFVKEASSYGTWPRRPEGEGELEVKASQILPISPNTKAATCSWLYTSAIRFLCLCRYCVHLKEGEVQG